MILYPIIVFTIILLIISVRVLYVKLKPKKVVLPPEKLTETQQEILKDAEKFKFVNYRGTILKMTEEETKLFYGANRRQRNEMVKLALKGQDFTKHFKSVQP